MAHATTVQMTSAQLDDPANAASMIAPARTVMVGGFGLVGAPLRLIEALLNVPHARELTIISNNLGEPHRRAGESERMKTT